MQGTPLAMGSVMSRPVSTRPARSFALLSTVFGLAAVIFAPAGCGALGMGSPIISGTAGGPWCANRVAPQPPAPRADCPAACTGGCRGNSVCVVNGASGTTCPAGMACVIECGTSACGMAKLTCPPDADCEVHCDGMSSCQMAAVQCPAEASCTLSCNGMSTCQLATLRCGHGACRSSCGGPSASLGRVDCGGSCDCSSSCTDGGMSLAAGSMPAGVMDAMSPQAWMSQVSGAIDVAPRGSAPWTMTATACASGEPEGFAGVVLGGAERAPAVVRVASDLNHGLRAHISGPGLLGVDLTPGMCRKLEGAVRRSNRAVNRVKLLEGSLSLDCTTPDGVVISGTATFSNCGRATNDIAAINAANAAIDADTRGRVASFTPISAPAGEAPRLRQELRGLRVVVRASLVGGVVPGGGESAASAQRSIDEQARGFAERLGWVPVDESSPHDLTMDLAFSGHVTFVDAGGVTAVVLPAADRPSLRLWAGAAEVLSVPVGPRGLRCEVTGTRDERQSTCAQWVSRFGDARLVSSLNGSQALADLARRLQR